MKWFIYTAGIPGCGKTTLSRKLKKHLPELRIINWDTEKMRMFVKETNLKGVPQSELWKRMSMWLAELGRERVRLIDQQIAEQAEKELVRGSAKHVLLDVVSYKRDYRKPKTEAARKGGRKVLAVLFTADPDTCYDFIRNRYQQGGNYVRKSSVDWFWDNFEPIEPDEYDAVLIVPPDASPEEAATAVARAVKEKQPERNLKAINECILVGREHTTEPLSPKNAYETVPAKVLPPLVQEPVRFRTSTGSEATAEIDDVCIGAYASDGNVLKAKVFFGKTELGTGKAKVIRDEERKQLIFRLDNLTPEGKRLIMRRSGRRNIERVTVLTEDPTAVRAFELAHKRVEQTVRAIVRETIRFLEEQPELKVKLEREPRYLFVKLPKELKSVVEEISPEWLKNLAGTKHLAESVIARTAETLGNKYEKYADRLIKRLKEHESATYQHDYEPDLHWSEAIEAPLCLIEKAFCELKKPELIEQLNFAQEQLTILKNISLEEIVDEKFTKTILVDEEGYFSNCPSYCDDCFRLKCYTKEAVKLFPEVREHAEKMYISSRKTGQSYRYFLASSDVNRLIAEAHAPLLRRKMFSTVAVAERQVNTLKQKLNELHRHASRLERIMEDSSTAPEEPYANSP